MAKLAFLKAPGGRKCQKWRTFQQKFKLKKEISIVRPSSERIEELWVVVGFYEGVEEFCHWWKYGDMNL